MGGMGVEHISRCIPLLKRPIRIGLWLSTRSPYLSTSNDGTRPGEALRSRRTPMGRTTPMRWKRTIYGTPMETLLPCSLLLKFLHMVSAAIAVVGNALGTKERERERVRVRAGFVAPLGSFFLFFRRIRCWESTFDQPLFVPSIVVTSFFTFIYFYFCLNTLVAFILRHDFICIDC